MATKKQKHAAAVARREKFMADLRNSNLDVLRKARARRFEESLKAWEKGHQKHHKFVDECPHCSLIKKATSRGVPIKDAQQYPGLLVTGRTDEEPENEAVAELLRGIFSKEHELADGSSLEMECI